MSIIKIEDNGFVALMVWDIPKMRQFLDDFDLVDVGTSKGRLFSRDHGKRPVLQVVDPVEQGFVGLGLRAHAMRPS